MIKKHKSTVLSLAWSPNNKFLVTGSADMKCRVFSAYLEGIDSEADTDGYAAIFPDQHEFGEVLMEFDQAKSWVHAVAWSPSPYRLAFAGHSSILSFVQLTSGSAQPQVQSILVRDLPFLDIQFISPNTLVAAGFESNIDIFTVKEGSSESQPVWEFKDKVDKKAGSSTTGGTSGSSPTHAGSVSGSSTSSAGVLGKAAAFGGGGLSARTAFVNLVDLGSYSPGAPDTNTKHKNIIANIVVDHQGKKITTAGLDGRVLVWNLAPLGLK